MTTILMDLFSMTIN